MPPRTLRADIVSKRSGYKITHGNQCPCQIAMRNTEKGTQGNNNIQKNYICRNKFGQVCERTL